MKSFLYKFRTQRGSPGPIRDVEVLVYLKSRAQRGAPIAKKVSEVLL